MYSLIDGMLVILDLVLICCLIVKIIERKFPER